MDKIVSFFIKAMVTIFQAMFQYWYGLQLLLTFCFVLVQIPGSSQSFTQSVWTHTIHSFHLKEDRDIIEFAPDTTPLSSSPLILVLDAETLFLPAVSATDFLSTGLEQPQIPKAVVVGIYNTLRERDMPLPQHFTPGGKEAFASFIKDELLPVLGKKYSLNGHTVLLGHSQGGLFATYLAAEYPSIFSWVVALDAPLDVHTNTKQLLYKLATHCNDTSRHIRFVSIETTFGLKEKWSKFFDSSSTAWQLQLYGESHESMSFKGVYDGLKYIYRDFGPTRKDLNLAQLQNHYNNISQRYGFRYLPPQKTLLFSARRKIGELQKLEALALLQYAKERYGSSQQMKALLTQTERINDETQSVVHKYSTLPKPNALQIKPYIGRWRGELQVARGQNVPVDLTIKFINETAKAFTALPWNPSQSEELEILSILNDSLVFGRRNSGGGLYVSIAIIDAKGRLTGREEWIGFVIPDGVPADVRRELEFLQKNPNVFSLRRE